MATIKYLLQSKSEISNIYVRYSISRKIVLKRKTGFVINTKDWSEDKARPKSGKTELIALKIKLDKLATFINDAHNNAIGTGIEFTGDWLQQQIDLFNNKTPLVELDILTNYIQKYIDEAPYKQNAKKETGLSAGRIQNLRLFKNTILRYEKECLNDKSILIKDINIKFTDQYKIWMFDKGYSVEYVGKNIANFLTICNDASKNEIETSPQYKNIKGVSEKREPEDIVFLNESDLDSIKKAPIIREALTNARKWLLLGCLIGQRGGDLLNITEKNIKVLGGFKIIELKQQKTGKLVAIPLIPEAIEILENGFPYKISLARFNEYIKVICQVAELKAPTKGRKKGKKGKPTVKGTYPKYEVISSHVCRRSFATNFYGRIPTPVLMNITGHGTERMFLSYIGKTSYDHAYQMLEYFSKLTPKTTTPFMEVIKNTAK